MRPTAALGFVHRPEGWNTAIDPETGLRDEIIDAQTGRPLLEAADFDALASVIDGNGDPARCFADTHSDTQNRAN